MYEFELPGKSAPIFLTIIQLSPVEVEDGGEEPEEKNPSSFSSEAKETGFEDGLPISPVFTYSGF